MCTDFFIFSVETQLVSKYLCISIYMCKSLLMYIYTHNNLFFNNDLIINKKKTKKIPRTHTRPAGGASNLKRLSHEEEQRPLSYVYVLVEYIGIIIYCLAID